MINTLQLRDGRKLLRDGWSDEDVERLTGLGLPNILELRVEAAAAAHHSGACTAPHLHRPFRGESAKAGRSPRS